MLHMPVFGEVRGRMAVLVMHSSRAYFLGLHILTLLASSLSTTPGRANLPMQGVLWPPKSRPPSRGCSDRPCSGGRCC